MQLTARYSIKDKYAHRGVGDHYIHAEKLRHTNIEATAALARAGRYKSVAGNLRVKEVQVAPDGDGDGGARAVRFVVCHNPEQADRDAQVRANPITHLEQLIDGSDTWTARRRNELVGALKTKPGLRRYLRRTPAGLLHIDRAAAKREAHLDGKWLLRTSDATLIPDDLAAAYKQLLAVEYQRLARHEVQPRPTPGPPPPRGPHPRPRPTVLAGAAADPGRRDHHHPDLAQHPARTGPDAPGHPGHRRRHRRPTQPDHPRPTQRPGRSEAGRTAAVLRVHSGHRAGQRLTGRAVASQAAGPGL
jgi:hypothetical protein